MLQSFVGTIDTRGLRSFRSEDASGLVPSRMIGDAVPFWAILDSQELPPIVEALIHGKRGAALMLLEERAHSLGPLCE